MREKRNNCLPNCSSNKCEMASEYKHFRNEGVIRAVIFDIDGTVVDSVDAHAKAWQIAFAEFGKDVSFGAIRKEIGKGAGQLLPVFFSKDELERFGKELDQYRVHSFPTRRSSDHRKSVV